MGLVLMKGMSIIPVGNLQEQLFFKGFSPGSVDNIFGVKTETAVKQFQSSVGLNSTGIVDETTWLRLFDGLPLPVGPYRFEDKLSVGEEITEEIEEISFTLPNAENITSMPRQAQSGTYIIIDVTRKTLTLYVNNAIAAIYPVAVGKPSTPTPLGNFTILNKAVDPGGVFGSRWMAFTNRGHGIHGTNQPQSIGNAVSNGCVRMHNADVERLFAIVQVGTRVSIIASDSTTSSQSTASSTYVVRAGDTLYSIAQRFGTTVDAIKSANNLTTDNLSVGQVLRIPRSTTSGSGSSRTYTVVAGDTLYTIAQRFGTTVNAIKSANNLTSDSLYIGQTLVIPSSSSSPPPQTSSGRTYTVIAGDTLYTIAQRFGTTVDAIKSANNLTSDSLYIGQTLVIPSSSSSPPPQTSSGRYTVRAGDTLYSIAQQHNTTVAAIRSANNLTSDNIFVGQTLIIPS